MGDSDVITTQGNDGKRILAFASIGIGYIAYLWLVIPVLIPRFLPDLNTPILSLSDLTGSFVRDFVFCTLLPLVAFAFASRRMERIPSPSDEQRKRNVAILSIASLLIVLIYVLFGQKTLDGFYEWLRYPLFVAQSEELLFRGVIFWGVYTCMGKGRNGLIVACVVSGALWGAVHGVLPALESGGSVFFSALPNVGGGIIFGSVFAMVFLKTGSLSVPIAFHALLDCLSMV